MITLPTISVDNVDREADHEQLVEEIEQIVEDVDTVDENSKRSLRVLIVDDVNAISFTLSRLIGNLGHAAESAQSVAEALSIMEETCPDVVFSDISMPEMNGYEFATESR